MIHAKHILSRLQEEYAYGFKSQTTGKFCEIFLNPSLSEIKNHIDGEFVRFLIPKNDPDKFYAWDADNALHVEVVDFLKKKEHAEDMTFFKDTFRKSASTLSRIKDIQNYFKDLLKDTKT